MDFGARLMESISGSITHFKKREREAHSEEQEAREARSRWSMERGVRVLRKFRAVAFEAGDLEHRQTFLEEARAFADRFAEYVLSERLEVPTEEGIASFSEEVDRLVSQFGSLDAETKYATPPSTVVTNLRRGTDDMLARIDLLVGSAEHPTRRLTREEILDVINEFTFGTNLLSPYHLRNVFDPDVRVGGVLTGGLVYTLVAKRVVDRYAEHPSGWRPFAIALDAEGKHGVCERGTGDSDATVVYVFDDMISKGGSVRAASEAAGEAFPNATIYSGTGTSRPQDRAYEKKRQSDSHLSMAFQDYCDAHEEEHDVSKARRLFREASAYARAQGVELPRGFLIRKGKIDAEFGPDPME